MSVIQFQTRRSIVLYLIYRSNAVPVIHVLNNDVELNRIDGKFLNKHIDTVKRRLSLIHFLL